MPFLYAANGEVLWFHDVGLPGHKRGYPRRPESRMLEAGGGELLAQALAHAREVLGQLALAAGFGHRGDNCTFETLQMDFKIHDRKVKVLAEIIHDADLADGKFGRKEGYGIDEVLKGWARLRVSDQDILDRGMQLIEGLYHSLT